MDVEIVSTPSSKRYAYAVIVGWWPERSLKAKGYRSGSTLYIRQATKRELVELQEAMRCISYTYADWSSLVADELLYGIDANACVSQWLYGGVLPYEPANQALDSEREKAGLNSESPK